MSFNFYTTLGSNFSSRMWNVDAFRFLTNEYMKLETCVFVTSIFMNKNQLFSQFMNLQNYKNIFQQYFITYFLGAIPLYGLRAESQQVLIRQRIFTSLLQLIYWVHGFICPETNLYNSVGICSRGYVGFWLFVYFVNSAV